MTWHLATVPTPDTVEVVVLGVGKAEIIEQVFAVLLV
jgi:hypothetical protein